MAKGAVSKEQITKQILEMFPGAFQYDKELRIPMMEDGAEVQIKITMTCAKVNVERGGDTALPGVASTSNASTITKAAEIPIAEPTDEEKARVSDLLSKLGLQ